MTNNSESHKELIRLGLATTLKGNTPVISLARKAGEIQRCCVLTVRAEEIRKKDGRSHDAHYILGELTYAPKIFTMELNKIFHDIIHKSRDRLTIFIHHSQDNVRGITKDVSKLYPPPKQTILTKCKGNQEFSRLGNN